MKPNFYWCNTNRTFSQKEWGDELYTEQLMREKSCAMAWGQFEHRSTMKKVRRGDLVLMFARGVGLIGIGKALGGRQVASFGKAQFIDRAKNKKERMDEWRIPVKWLAWEGKGQRPLSWKEFSQSKGTPFQPAFLWLNPKKWESAIQRALAHFELRNGDTLAHLPNREERQAPWSLNQGWERDPKKRKKLERTAEQQAKVYFKAKGYKFIKREGKPFDLHFRKGKQDLHVEVKGTASDGSRVIVTRGEREYWRKTSTDMKLFVLPNIKLNKALRVVSTGEPFTMSLKDEKLVDKRLKATHYELTVDTNDQEARAGRFCGDGSDFRISKSRDEE
ncbi:MAG: DUF3883 domain-containing protein [Planctomycetes bacterium]|nr:DUF3883 domain-containing protein [Planctomycetota bacterium]